MGCNSSQDWPMAVENKVEAVKKKSKEMLNDLKESSSSEVKEATGAQDIDIDLDDPKTEEAATKIQAAFRGHKTRRTMKAADKNPESEQNFEAEFSPDDKELIDAATKIQASFRGHIARKTVPQKGEAELSKEMEKLDAKAQEEELDIDLNDPELAVAATKIQASFRGHKIRREKENKE